MVSSGACIAHSSVDVTKLAVEDLDSYTPDTTSTVQNLPVSVKSSVVPKFSPCLLVAVSVATSLCLLVMLVTQSRRLSALEARLEGYAHGEL